jgi:hypothetical protein
MVGGVDEPDFDSVTDAHPTVSSPSFVGSNNSAAPMHAFALQREQMATSIARRS